MLHVFADFVCNSRVETLFLSHLLFDVRPRHLVELVYRGRNCTDLFWCDTAHLEYAVKDSSVVQLMKSRQASDLQYISEEIYTL